MALKLLSQHLNRSLHIALFILISLWGFQVKAQSVLLPGDVAVVSVNAANNSVDLIPLIDVEKGTVINLSAGKWDASEGLLTGTEATLYLKRDVQAGTNLHVDGTNNEIFDFNGRLPFGRSQNQFYVFQKDENVYRFIYGLRFGDVDADLETLSTEIPPVLSETENTFVQLGEKQNHQYYIRNGASGTQNMLLGFVGDSGNWKNSDTSFIPFGTSFNVLTPPVVMFQETTSSFKEGDSLASLKVMIFEHDGSRVSVDVAFESPQSSADSLDFSELKTKTLNFTGLVGTYTTEIPLNIPQDENFEGREGAIFALQDLSGGSLGDFITHSLSIEDHRTPKLVITDVSNERATGSVIEISNLENSEVSLKGWVLSTDHSSVKIDSNLILGAYKKIKLFDGVEHQVGEESMTSFRIDGLSKNIFSGDGGLLSLSNYDDKIVHQVGYRSSWSEDNNAIAGDRTSPQVESNRIETSPADTEISTVQNSTKGWVVAEMSSEIASSLSSEKTLYAWDDRSKAFKPLSSLSVNSDAVPVLGFYEADELNRLQESIPDESFRSKENTNTLGNFRLSARDLNGNGSIEGSEGLNLLLNSTDNELSAGAFLEVVEGVLNSPNSMEVYRIDRDGEGSLEFEALELNETVAPGSYFWISMERELEPTLVELDLEELLETNRQYNVVNTDSRSSDEIGFVQFALRSGSKQKYIDLYLDAEGQLQNKKDLNAYTELLPKEHTALLFSFKQSDTFYNAVTIPRDTEQIVSIPLSFGGSNNDSYTLSVSDWKNVPSDWSINLIDTYNDNEYSLRDDFSVTFDRMNAGNEEKLNSDRYAVQLVTLAAKEQENEILSDVPKEIELNQNYPNPFNPVTTISFYLPESQDVKLSIFNIVGQPVAVLFEGRLTSGQQQFEWDATDKPSGMYIYQLEVGDKVMTRKMTLVK